MGKKIIKEVISLRVTPGLKKEMDSVISALSEDYQTRTSFIENAIREKLAIIYRIEHLYQKAIKQKYEEKNANQDSQSR